MTSLNEQVLKIISGDRVRAHNTIFAHRHPLPTAPFQAEIIRAFHSDHPRVVCEAFRKAAKSTIAEETLCLGAGLVEFKNALIIGASYDRACERLESVKHELETNADLEQAFGVLKSDATWTTDKIILANGVVIQAKGAGQSLRGVKHHAQPPDFVIVDDLEDDETVKTPALRQAMLKWFYKTLIAACTKEARIRFIGNRLDPEAVIVKVSEDAEWKHLIFPILYRDLDTGEEKATWPEAWPLEWCWRKRTELFRLGLAEVWSQEYMCEAEAPEAKVFRSEHFATIVRTRVRTHQPTWIMIDPARSVGKRSASTAMPVFSWIGNRLVVWDCPIGHWLPDEIVDRIFALDAEYQPVLIGIEQDALNQFLLQPIRQGMMKRGVLLPLQAMTAKRYTQGRGKLDFIKSLQPFFAAGEVEYAQLLPLLTGQFLSFPKGEIDGPNALAYAPRMRPGAPIYEDFAPEHTVDDLSAIPFVPLQLAIHAHGGFTTAVLAQYDGRRLLVLADYVEEGDPGQAAGALVRRASVEARGRALQVTVPPQHFEQWTNVGLRAALGRVPVDASMGGSPVQGREEIRTLLKMTARSSPAVAVSAAARWTMNGFAGGYCRSLTVSGALGDKPEDNFYATLFAGLESFVALTRVGSGAPLVESDIGVRRARDGTLYRSAMRDRSEG